MAIRTWEVDDSNVVEANIRPLGKVVLKSNGRLLTDSLSARKSGEFRFAMMGGRQAIFTIKRQLASAPDFSLQVDGRLMVPTRKVSVSCGECAAIVRPNDRFCQKCGRAMPAPETYLHQENVKKATVGIAVLSGLFALSGIAMYVVSTRNAAPLLAKLGQMDQGANYPTAIHGVTYTVAALRSRIVWESQSMLIVNMILAAVMGALAFWSRRAPLPAVLIAAATYAVVTVASAIQNPVSLAQGIYIKVAVVLLLARGIKAALALRSTHA